MMRKRAWLFVAILGLAAACKDDDEVAANAINSDEAAALVATSLASNGVSAISSTSAEFATSILGESEGGRAASCGFTEDFDLTGESDEGSPAAYSFRFNYKFELLCAEQEPTSIAVALDYIGDFSTSEMKIDYSGLAALQLRGLDDKSSAFVMDGQYKYGGAVLDKNQSRTVNSAIEMTLSDLTISKSHYQVTGGTGTYEIKGAVSSKGSFKYSGNIKFLGAGKAEVTVNGVAYLADTYTGSATRK
jgi:hypothetical protein